MSRTDAEPNRDFEGAVADPAMVAEAWAAWRAEIDFADQFIGEQADPSVVGPERIDGRVGQ
jgi:hypothetical protein